MHLGHRTRDSDTGQSIFSRVFLLRTKLRKLKGKFISLFPRMLDLPECWEPRIFFIQDFTPVKSCCSSYGTVEKQGESQHSKKSQDSTEQNLPK